MCTTCGCEGDSHHHHHHHHHDHHHEGEHIHHVEIDILGENNRQAMYNRGWLEAKNIFTLNLVSSPGSGKTSLLEETVKRLKDKVSIAVIEGDQQTSNDADRISSLDVKAIQINTGNGCHLDAAMVNNAVKKLEIQDDSILFIENVGNLVCPAMFDLGESKRVVVISVTEGDDKPLKYPNMFAESDVCVINKIDLLPYVRSDVEKIKENCRKVNKDMVFFELSAFTGEGMDEWCEFLLAEPGNNTVSHCHENMHHHHHHDTAYFDEVAESWDNMVNHDKDKIMFLLSKADVKRGDRVLDVGTGTGILLPVLSELAGMEGVIRAVDASGKMIKVAERKFSSLSNVTFEVADIEHYSSDEKYDRIILYSMFPHLHNGIETVRKLVEKNLLPGGILMIAHSESRDAINNRHKGKDFVLDSFILPSVEVLAEMLENDGLRVISALDNEDYYFVILGRK